jgi:hypothetical protein
VTDQCRQPGGGSVTLRRRIPTRVRAPESTRKKLEEPHESRFFRLRPPFRPVCVRCGRAFGFIDPFHGD